MYCNNFDFAVSPVIGPVSPGHWSRHFTMTSDRDRPITYYFCTIKIFENYTILLISIRNRYYLHIKYIAALGSLVSSIFIYLPNCYFT